MYRFVLSRRWLGFALFVILLSGVCVRLGLWQLDRLHQRIDANDLVRSNMSSRPVALQDVENIPAGRRSGQEWQPVRVRGSYDSGRQVVLKYQTRNAQPGVEIITPLTTSSGKAVLVDRGWMASDNNSDAVTDIPAPPAGTVSVSGWWRPDSTADDHAVEPENGQVRAISSTGIATALDYPLYSGYLNVRQQQPTGEGGLQAEPRPDLGQGPHFFYAMQWFFFAALAVFGWFYFAWSEAHPDRRRQHSRADEGAPQADNWPARTGNA